MVEGDEAKARRKYFVLIGLAYFVLGPFLAFSLLFLFRLLDHDNVVVGQNRAIEILREYDLGWLYFSWCIIFLTRMYATINANGARAAAKIGRPDQHVYRTEEFDSSGEQQQPSKEEESFLPINGEEGKKKEGVVVLMENVGAGGRFNRAQRAAFNMDESLELLVVGIALSGFVVPRIICFLSIIYAFGRIKFTNAYTNSLERRARSSLIYSLPQIIISAFVGIFAFESLTSLKES
mmetsp:Transcript_33373/g.36927  ORF Transcript_33373/g.36927 Transcript_33373/m.36927 type:complete len:236 (+) Transcript_33373:90-797(+)